MVSRIPLVLTHLVLGLCDEALACVVVGLTSTPALVLHLEAAGKQVSQCSFVQEAAKRIVYQEDLPEVRAVLCFFGLSSIPESATFRQSTEEFCIDSHQARSLRSARTPIKDETSQESSDGGMCFATKDSTYERHGCRVISCFGLRNR